MASCRAPVLSSVMWRPDSMAPSSNLEMLADTCHLLPKRGKVLEADHAALTAGRAQKNRFGQGNGDTPPDPGTVRLIAATVCAVRRLCHRRVVVPGAGIEPAWPCGRGILSPLRLPVSPPGRLKACWRRGSESNRRPRLCRPLHDHSATPPGVGYVG